MLHDGRLYVVNDNEEASWVAAFDAGTGEELWRTERDETSNWSTPFVWENDVRTELVTTGQNGVKSYGLDGELLWQLSGMSSLVIPTPFSDDGLLYINSGYVADRNRPVYAIRAGASGDITLPEGATSNDYIVWSHPQLGSYNPSSLVYGGTHYTLLDRGILMAYDAGTGEEVYRRRRITAGTLFSASPWAYNGKIFALSEDGEHLRHAGGRGVRGARAQRARRDDPGDPGGGPRQPAHPHGVGPLPDRGERRLSRRVGEEYGRPAPAYRAELRGGERQPNRWPMPAGRGRKGDA